MSKAGKVTIDSAATKETRSGSSKGESHKLKKLKKASYGNVGFSSGSGPNPSIAPSDGSCPFLDLPPKVIDEILCHIQFPKDKMRLETVCRKLALRAQSPNAWRLNAVLALCCDIEAKFGLNVLSQDYCLLICGTPFSLTTAPKALDVLLQRMCVRVLLKSGHWGPAENQHQLRFVNSLSQVIVRHKATFDIHRIVLMDGSPWDTAWFLGAARTCGVEDLEVLQCRSSKHGGLRFTAGFNDTFWSFVGACSNLKEFHFQPNSSFSEVNAVVMGMAVKHAVKLRQLSLADVNGLDATTLASMCNACPNLHVLGVKRCNDVNPMEFGNFLEYSSRESITSLGFGLDEANAKHREFTRSISEYFPNIKTVALTTRHNFWSEEHVVKTITALLHAFGEHNRTVTIVMPTKQAGLISKELGKADGPCDRVTVEPDHYKCTKGRLVIQVDITSGWKPKPHMSVGRLLKQFWKTIHPEDDARPPAMTMIQLS